MHGQYKGSEWAMYWQCMGIVWAAYRQYMGNVRVCVSLWISRPQLRLNLIGDVGYCALVIRERVRFFESLIHLNCF